MLTKSFLFGPAGKTFENVQNLLMSKVIANLVIYNRLKYTKFRAPEFIPGFSGVRVTRSFVLCVCFVDHCLSFCTVSFGHCVVCSASIYGF